MKQNEKVLWTWDNVIKLLETEQIVDTNKCKTKVIKVYQRKPYSPPTRFCGLHIIGEVFI